MVQSMDRMIVFDVLRLVKLQHLLSFFLCAQCVVVCIHAFNICMYASACVSTPQLPMQCARGQKRREEKERFKGNCKGEEAEGKGWWHQGKEENTKRRQGKRAKRGDRRSKTEAWGEGSWNAKESRREEEEEHWVQEGAAKGKSGSDCFEQREKLSMVWQELFGMA